MCEQHKGRAGGQRQCQGRSARAGRVRTCISGMCPLKSASRRWTCSITRSGPAAPPASDRPSLYSDRPQSATSRSTRSASSSRSGPSIQRQVRLERLGQLGQPRVLGPIPTEELLARLKERGAHRAVVELLAELGGRRRVLLHLGYVSERLQRRHIGRPRLEIGLERLAVRPQLFGEPRLLGLLSCCRRVHHALQPGRPAARRAHRREHVVRQPNPQLLQQLDAWLQLGREGCLIGLQLVPARRQVVAHRHRILGAGRAGLQPRVDTATVAAHQHTGYQLLSLGGQRRFKASGVHQQQAAMHIGRCRCSRRDLQRAPPLRLGRVAIGAERSRPRRLHVFGDRHGRQLGKRLEACRQQPRPLRRRLNHRRQPRPRVSHSAISRRHRPERRSVAIRRQRQHEAVDRRQSGRSCD
eukprot:scaffold5766_cov110-Isochrysis_galbana.AAC.5